MKRTILILTLNVFFFTVFAGHNNSNGTFTSLVYRDGIDKRIAQTKRYLAANLSKKELKSLLFSEAVVHTKDSSDYYIKIPFANVNYPGFMLVKKQGNRFQYAQIRIQGYRYKDTALFTIKDTATFRRHIPVVISSNTKKINKTFMITCTGKVEKMTSPRPENGIKDTAFSLISFMPYIPEPGNEMSLVNMNFIFDPIDTLNYQKLNKGVIIHDMIPLAFRQVPSFTLEFSNSDILKPIDIKKMF
jgi:hypothetical protein